MSAAFAAAGWHINPSVTHRPDRSHIFEADVVASKWSPSGNERILVEAKSGKKSGMGDVFKLLGQQHFLDLGSSVLVRASDSAENIDSAIGRLTELGVSVLNACKTESDLSQALEPAGFGKAKVEDIQCWHFALTIRRKLLEGLGGEYEDPGIQGFVAKMKEQEWVANDALFEDLDPLIRLSRLCELYKTHGKLAKSCEKVLSASGEPGGQIKDANAVEAHPLMYTAMFLDLRARMATATAVVEYLSSTDFEFDELAHVNELLKLPSSMAGALEQLRSSPELGVFPLIWQCYIYRFGGFLVLGRIDVELKSLADQCGVSSDVVKSALGLWDLLFPGFEWYSEIYGVRLLKFVPAPLQGLGSFHRASIAGLERQQDGTMNFENVFGEYVDSFLRPRYGVCWHRYYGQDRRDENLS